MEFKDKLKTLRKSKYLSQEALAKELYVSRSLIARWEAGLCLPTMESLEKIAEYFSTAPEYLQYGTTYPTNAVKADPAARTPVQFWGKVSAGVGAYAEGIPIRTMAADDEDMQEGDIVICRKQATADSGDICVVLVDNETATCKKIKKTDEGITLIGLNPAFTPLFFSWREVAEKPVSVLGLVVELRAQF